ncbi:MAG: PKD domain-containing protein [Candidatus Saccharimonadales bacterium]
MLNKFRYSAQWVTLIFVGVCLLSLVAVFQKVSAINQIPIPSPIPGSYGLEATKKKDPPVQGATITTPGNGSSFTTSPITVNGICPNDLLVEIFNNGVMVGSVICKNGSFSVQVSLFAGANELTAIVYDEVDQPGPTSNSVTVNYTDTKFTAFGALVTLTSSYGRRAASAGSSLSWPLQLSGGNGPYAFSIDWGDGSAAELKSQSLAGLVTISHVFKKAGIYQVNIKVTDANGASAFLQVIAVANGKVDSSTAVATDEKTAKTATKTQILWIPTVIALVLLLPTYWLGRRSQLVSIRNKMLKDRDNYEKQQAQK